MRINFCPNYLSVVAEVACQVVAKGHVVGQRRARARQARASSQMTPRHTSGLPLCQKSSLIFKRLEVRASREQVFQKYTSIFFGLVREQPGRRRRIGTANGKGRKKGRHLFRGQIFWQTPPKPPDTFSSLLPFFRRSLHPAMTQIQKWHEIHDSTESLPDYLCTIIGAKNTNNLRLTPIQYMSKTKWENK